MIEYNIYLFLYNLSAYFEPEQVKENSTESAVRRFKEFYGKINEETMCKLFGAKIKYIKERQKKFLENLENDKFFNA